MAKSTATQEEIAYIAGLFEGEACFGLNRVSPVIKLSMTDYDVVAKAKTIVGGNGSILVASEATFNHKMVYCFSMYGNHAIEWMKLIYPYLGSRRREKIDSIIKADKDNVRTHCRRDHELIGNNVYIDKNGVRQCRECKKLRSNRSYHKKALRIVS